MQGEIYTVEPFGTPGDQEMDYEKLVGAALTLPVPLVPAYQKPDCALASRLRTFDTCQRPPRAVLTPRPFRAAAIPR